MTHKLVPLSSPGIEQAREPIGDLVDIKAFLKRKPTGLCDPECEGRCRVCPLDYVEELLAALATVNAQAKSLIAVQQHAKEEIRRAATTRESSESLTHAAGTEPRPKCQCGHREGSHEAREGCLIKGCECWGYRVGSVALSVQQQQAKEIRAAGQQLASRLTAIRASFEKADRGVDYRWQLSRFQDDLEGVFGLRSSNLDALSRDEGSVTPERTTKDDDQGAGLIGQAIPDVEGTLPRPNFWMGDENHAGRKVVVVSLKSRIKEWRAISTKARNAYEGEHMRVPLEYFADAVAEAAFLLEKRLGAILEYPEAK